MARKPYLKDTRYVTALCVWTGSAPALIECMRYDSCYPASEVEANKIQRLINNSAEPADHVIRLIRVARTDMPPTIDRWRSFGSLVLDVRHPEDSPLTDAELANLVKINHEIAPGKRGPAGAR